MAEPTPLPWDTSAGNRFAPYTADNHSATLWIASLLGLIYVVGVLLIRLFIKIKVLGADDWLIAASTVSSTFPTFHYDDIGLTEQLGSCSWTVCVGISWLSQRSGNNNHQRSERGLLSKGIKSHSGTIATANDSLGSVHKQDPVHRCPLPCQMLWNISPPSPLCSR